MPYSAAPIASRRIPALEPLRSTVSLPFEPGENRKAAVKTAGDRGIEPLKVLPVSE